MALKYFCAYHSYLDALSELNDEECGRLFKACLLYSKDGLEMSLTGNERFVFPSFRGQIDRDREKYADRCAKNQKNRQLGIRKQTTIVDDRDQREKEGKENGKEKGEENGSSVYGVGATKEKCSEWSGIGRKL